MLRFEFTVNDGSAAGKREVVIYDGDSVEAGWNYVHSLFTVDRFSPIGSSVTSLG